jgi:hypothetical protein
VGGVGGEMILMLNSVTRCTYHSSHFALFDRARLLVKYAFIDFFVHDFESVKGYIESSVAKFAAF